MRTFIQLQDGIGFAVVHTDGDVDHTVTPDHVTAIEVFTDNPEQFLKKKYDSETNSWDEPELYVWGVPDWDGTIIEICRTYFEHEIQGPILPEDFKGDWKWKNSAWVIPQAPTHDALGNPLRYYESPFPDNVPEITAP